MLNRYFDPKEDPDFIYANAALQNVNYEVGQFIALGVGEGITGNISAVVKDTATLAEAIQDELNSNDYVLKPIDTDVTQSANDSMNNFANIITDGFNNLISKLEAIANGVTFAVPKAVNIVPYSKALSIKVCKFFEKL